MSEQKKDWTAENQAVLNKYQRQRERLEAKAEASEETLERFFETAKKNETVNRRLSQEVLNALEGRTQPDQRLIDYLRRTGIEQGANLGDLEGVVTGEKEAAGELPWQQD